MLGYSFTSLIGGVVAEIFEGPQFGSIFSLIMVSLLIGGAVGPWATGVLHDIEGYEHKEISAMLGIAEGTSKSQVFKARMKLRALLT